MDVHLLHLQHREAAALKKEAVEGFFFQARQAIVITMSGYV